MKEEETLQADSGATIAMIPKQKTLQESKTTAQYLSSVQTQTKSLVKNIREPRAPFLYVVRAKSSNILKGL